MMYYFILFFKVNSNTCKQSTAHSEKSPSLITKSFFSLN